MKKILLIRFSSIGDIVLTTPVVRCIKGQLKDVELHYVTKAVFGDLLSNNPYIDKLHTFKNDIGEVQEALASEKFDLVIDLHKNLRSSRLKRKLGVKSVSFNKINVQKFFAVNFKALRLLPAVHVVERYFEPVESLGVKSDGKGLDYFIPEQDKIDCAQRYFEGNAKPFIALVVGGSYYTKQIPLTRLTEIARAATMPVLLMGSATDNKIASQLMVQIPQLINTCGTLSINQSASVISQAAWVITSDTGLMHIASAFDRKIISLWGNTIPEFGMSPYMPQPENKILEVKNLKCRPCSKLGYHECPRKHFECMNNIDLEFVKDLS